MLPINKNDLTPFGQFALSLDSDFREFERLKSQLEKTELDSDFGLERAKQLLTKFSECGMRITEGIQGFAKALEDARHCAETAAIAVSARALVVQERQEACDRLAGRFQTLGEKVRKM